MLYLKLLAGLFLCSLSFLAISDDAQQFPAEGDQQQALQPAFAIWEFRVKGATLLDQRVIELSLKPFLGPDKTLQTVQDAANGLELAYKSNGFGTVYVNIPEQDVIGGVVLLEVVEGTVQRVRVSGSKYHLPSEIKLKLNSVERGQPLHIPSFQENLNAINSQSANLRVTPVLRAGKTPGTVEVDLRVKDELPLHAGMEVSNNNSKDTTRPRLSLDAGYDNLWQAHHSFSIQGQTSPEDTDEVLVLAGTYIFPVFDTASRVALYAVRSDSSVATLSDLTVIGDGKIFGARYVRALKPVPGISHSISVGIDYKDFAEQVGFAEGDDIITPIDYYMLAAIYNLGFNAEKSTTTWGFSINKGLRDSFGGADYLQFENKRFQSTANFLYAQISVKREDRFKNGWSTNGRLRLQVSDSPLISNEQFSAGGHASVRGYYESQILGDKGVVASLQLNTPDISFKLGLNQFRWTGRVFTEGAHTEVIEPLSEQDSSFSIASTGLGTTFEFQDSVTLEIDAGWALKESDDIDEGDLRVHAVINLKY